MIQENNIQDDSNFNQMLTKFNENYETATPRSNQANFNNTPIVIFGKTKSGKSTFFHLLKGDQLSLNEDDRLIVVNQQESFIGHGQQSYTKQVNQFTLQFQQSLDLIDCPGIEDTSENYDEIASSLHLIRLLQQYQRVVILLVVPTDYYSSIQIQQSLKYVSNLMKSDNDTRHLCQQQLIGLIMNRTKTENYQQERKKLSQNFHGIQQQGFQANEILKYFQQNIEDYVFFLKECPDKHHLDQCRSKLLNFIQTRKFREQKHIQYKFNVSDQSKMTAKDFLDNLQQFCQKQLERQLHIIESQQLDIDKSISLFLFLISFHLENIPLQSFYIISNKISQKLNQFNIQDLLSQRLRNIIFYFDENIIHHMCELGFNHCIQISQENIDGIVDKLKQLYQKNIEKNLQSQVELELFDKVSKALKQFQDLILWDQLDIFIGLPLCGKSEIIKHIYNPKNIDQMTGYVNNQIKQDLVQYYYKDKIKILEFRSLQKEILILLQRYFYICQENQKQFRIYVVINSNFEQDNIQIVNVLESFIKLNDFKDLNFIAYIQNLQFNRQIDQLFQFRLGNNLITKYKVLQKNFDQFEQREQNQMPNEINIQLNNQNLEPFQEISYLLDNTLNRVMAKTRELLNQKNNDFNCLSHYKERELSETDLNKFIALSEIELQSQKCYQQIRNLYKILEIKDNEVINQNEFNVYQKIKKAITYLLQKDQCQLFLKKHFYLQMWCDRRIQIIKRIIRDFQAIQDINQLDKISLLKKISSFYPEPLLPIEEQEILEQLQSCYSCFIKQHQNGQQNNENNFIKDQLPEINTLLEIYESTTKKLYNIAQLIKKSQKYGFTAPDFFIIKFFFHRIVYLFFDIYENKKAIKEIDKLYDVRDTYLKDPYFLKNIQFLQTN